MTEPYSVAYVDEQGRPTPYKSYPTPQDALNAAKAQNILATQLGDKKAVGRYIAVELKPVTVEEHWTIGTFADVTIGGKRYTAMYEGLNWWYTMENAGDDGTHYHRTADLSDIEVRKAPF
jgi:hypothetical protein